MVGIPKPDIDQRLRDLGGFIRDQRQLARLSVRKLSSMAGISNPYLSQIERGLRKPSADILQKLARGLQISAETLYEQAGFLDRSDGPDVVAAIMGDAGLTDQQRQALVQIYNSYHADLVVGADAPTPAPGDAPTPAPGAAPTPAPGAAPEVGGADAPTPSPEPTP